MNTKELLPFARDNFEARTFSVFGTCYRCAVTLNDGTYLPSVLICEDVDYVNHTLQQIEHGRQQDVARSRSEPREQFKRLRNQLAGICTVSPYSVRDVGPSPNAIPYKLIDDDLLFPYDSVNYILTLNDGTQRELTTHAGCQFVKLPDEYCASDVNKVSLLEYPNLEEGDEAYPCLDCVYFLCFANDWEKRSCTSG